MINASPEDPQTLTPLSVAGLDAVCDRFGKALDAGQRPRIEDFLGDVPDSNRVALLRELVAIEVEYRKRQGETPASGEYLSRFPALDREWLARELARALGNEGSPSPAEKPATGTPLKENRPLAGEVKRLRCPHCHNPIRLVEDRSEEVLCPGCGSSFRLRDARLTETASQTRQLGKFQMLERVGVGAFGAVWRARDTELHRLVALKIPHTGLLTEADELERFHREARAAAQLRHPGIVTVHEVAMLGGLPVIVAEFVSGATLRDLLGVRRPLFREAAELVAKVSEAVDYAHQMGVIHRDLKPANIMLEYCPRNESPTPTDEAVGPETTGRDSLGVGYPRVTDFGLALREEVEVTMTLEGQIIGTPAYMSPEQAAGRGHKVDRRSDVYSLGVILYELLTGELPFRGSKTMLLVQVLHEEPQPPRQLNDKIPRDLETICLKALAKEPHRRYASAHALADDLRRWLTDKTIEARPVSRAERIWRWCRRNQAVAILTAAVATLILSVAGVATVAAIKLAEIAESERAARRIAEDQEKAAVEARRQADETAGLALQLADQAGAHSLGLILQIIQIDKEETEDAKLSKYERVIEMIESGKIIGMPRQDLIRLYPN